MILQVEVKLKEKDTVSNDEVAVKSITLSRIRPKYPLTTPRETDSLTCTAGLVIGLIPRFFSKSADSP